MVTTAHAKLYNIEYRQLLPNRLATETQCPEVKDPVNSRRQLSW